MARLGINPTIDRISADRLGELRRALLTVGEVLPDQVMIRIADAIHDACMETWASCEAETAGVVPGEML